MNTKIINHKYGKSVFHKLSTKNAFLRNTSLSKKDKPLCIPTRLLGKHARYGKFHPFGLIPPEVNLSYRAQVWRSSSCYVMQSERHSLLGKTIQIKEGKPLNPVIKTGDDMDWKHLCEFCFEDDAQIFLNARYGIVQVRT